jgi:hypothetical protein
MRDPNLVKNSLESIENGAIILQIVSLNNQALISSPVRS